MATRKKPVQRQLLEPEVLTAMCIVGKEASKVRERLEVGQDQPIDFKCHVRGLLHVGDDQSQITTETPAAKALLCLLLETLGPKTRDEAVANVVHKCREFLVSGTAPVVSGAAKDLAEDLLTRVGRQTTVEKWGNVTGVLVPTIIH